VCEQNRKNWFKPEFHLNGAYRVIMKHHLPVSGSIESSQIASGSSSSLASPCHLSEGVNVFSVSTARATCTPAKRRLPGINFTQDLNISNHSLRCISFQIISHGKHEKSQQSVANCFQNSSSYISLVMCHVYTSRFRFYTKISGD
jgi:hypothetical protein